MDDLEKHKLEFDKIIKKYNLFEEHKAKQIATFLTKDNNKVDSLQFAKLFNMSNNEAKLFLSFIHKGIKFKEQHLDKK